HEPPPQEVCHGREGDVSVPGHLDIDPTEAGLAALNQRIEIVEGNFASLESTALEEIGDVKEAVDMLTEEHRDGLTNLELKLTEAVSALQGEIEALKQQLETARLVGGAGQVLVRETKIEGPKPKEFRGERNAQDVENFIWKMENYFEHLNLVDEAAKIRAATMYLADTAMLWWRRKKADIEKGTCSIRDWEQFKFELKRQYNEKKKANCPRNGCYLCKDPNHQYKDCPSLGKLGALIAAERRQTEGAKRRSSPGEPAAPERRDVAQLGHMMLGALLTKEPAKQVIQDKPNLAQMGQNLLGAVMGKEPRLKEKGSLFVDAKLNGQSVRITVDTGATHNFVTEAKAKSPGLVFSPNNSLLKTVNANLPNVNGVARNVQL
ncbi:hypothetical protein A4A49_60505, partial [Nicotiana attenuata]